MPVKYLGMAWVSSEIGSSANWTVFAVLCFLKIFQQLPAVKKLTNGKAGRARLLCIMFESLGVTCYWECGYPISLNSTLMMLSSLCSFKNNSKDNFALEQCYTTVSSKQLLCDKIQFKAITIWGVLKPHQNTHKTPNQTTQNQKSPHQICNTALLWISSVSSITQ